MRRLPPSNDREESSLSLAPKLLGLTIGLLLGYLLLPGAPGASAVEQPAPIAAAPAPR